MIRVQMPLTTAEPFPQFGQNLIHRRWTKLEPAAVRYDVRLPAAVHAPPLVANEAENTQPAMVGVIAALCRSAPLSVAPFGDLFPVDCTVSRLAKRAASRLAARLKRKGSHRDVCTCEVVLARIRFPNCAHAPGSVRVRAAV
jgi:hypothetical protein